jgi:hypothetical protein
MIDIVCDRAHCSRGVLETQIQIFHWQARQRRELGNIVFIFPNIWTSGLEPPVPFIQMNMRSLTYGCAQNAADVYRNYINVMIYRDAPV